VRGEPREPEPGEREHRERRHEHVSPQREELAERVEEVDVVRIFRARNRVEAVNTPVKRSAGADGGERFDR